MARVGLWRDGRLFSIYLDLHFVERDKCRTDFMRASTNDLATLADMVVAFLHRENLFWALCVSSTTDAHLSCDLASRIPLSSGVYPVRNLFCGGDQLVFGFVFLF